MNIPLWTPDQNKTTQLHDFVDFVNATHNLSIADYSSLHRWSTHNIADFWESLAEWGGVHFYTKAACVLSYGPPADSHARTGGSVEEEPPADSKEEPFKRMNHHMINARWFEGATLNLAEHLLRHNDEAIACFSVTEKGEPIAHTFGELKNEVAAFCAYYKSIGLEAGDRICAVAVNNHQTLVCMLACIALGGVWASASPDYGLEALKDRFEQIEPTVLIASERYIHRGKNHVISETVKNLKTTLPTVLHVISLESNSEHQTYASILKDYKADDIPFKQLDFNHPVWILFSSGTTGKPKCMVHRTGGMLLQHLKEHRLHGDLRANDRLFFYTTCSWMMWHWMISAFLVGASIVLYEGSPFSPNPERLLDIVDSLGVTAFGVGAKYLEHIEKLKLQPIQSHRLSKLRILFTTGSPLLPESFDYVYQSISNTVQLCSISGGSDLVSCFALGCPILPVHRGELQCLGLGMDIAIYNTEGEPVIDEEGELVCQQAFPCMPVYFWGDIHRKKYMKAYFKRFPGVWTHGDFAKITQNGGLIIKGRSDATLNRGGIRLGTAELYQAISSIDVILESIAVEREGELLLFVKLSNPHSLESKKEQQLFQEIKNHIKEHLSPKHLPDHMFIAPDLPKTHNGKLVELAVKKIMNDQEDINTDTLSNPGCMDYFMNLNTKLGGQND